MKIKTLTVSEVNNYLKRIIDNDFILNNLSVKGEISNLKYHSSGHIYFSLKDSFGKLNCVMFRNKAEDLTFKLEEGMSVIAKGRASVYTANGSFQLYCDELEKEGLGELYVKFEKLKERLNREGYFDESLKKDIPSIPKRIGIVTSEKGAAVRDIINVSNRRNKLVDLVIYPARVQGINAYKDVIKGIEYFNLKKSVDVIIIGRGGGSIEELWNFNEEELALAIFNSKIPIISAVGHEVDFTISDFVADLRAATPSQAAEMAVPLEERIFESLKSYEKYLNDIIKDRLSREKARLNSLEKILSLNSPQNKIYNNYVLLDNLKDRMDKNILNRLKLEKEKLSGYNSLLTAHNPVNLLSRGYAIIEDDNKNIVSSINKLKNDNNITINLKDGSIKGKFQALD